MKRWSHRLIQGQCTRCGCDSRVKRCPPGFWMTQAEVQAWSALPSDRARSEMERRLTAGDTKGVPSGK